MPPIALIDQAGSPELVIRDLPVWQGMRRKPGVTASHSFRLGFTGPGPLRQLTTPDFLDRIIGGYAAEDYSFLTAPPGSSAWSNTLGDRKAATVVRLCRDHQPSAVLEIGAGSTYVGEKLRSLLPSIHSYVAVDPAISGAAPGIETVRGYFPAPELAGRAFDLILGFSCLEHVPSPETMLAHAAHALTDNGLLIMAFPDTEQALHRGDLNVVLHEHLTYFTRASVQWLAGKVGLGLRTLESVNDVFTAVFTKTPAPDRSEKGPPETDLLIQAATSLATLVKRRGAEIRDLLEQGRTVAFHGATNGLNNFLHLSGLGGHAGISLFDGDTAKHGLYLPACTQPVSNPADPAYAEADVIYVSAVSFFDAIAREAVQIRGVETGRLRRLEA